jgi:hypothetical protein
MSECSIGCCQNISQYFNKDKGCSHCKLILPSYGFREEVSSSQQRTDSLHYLKQ